MTASNSAVTSTGRARRRLIIAIGVVVFIVVVFHLAGGWYFAGILETDALIPQAPSRDFGVVALDADASSITLSGTDDAIRQQGRLGLWWEGGYAQVDAILDENSESVVRVLIPISGLPPICDSPHTETCDQLDLEAVAYGQPSHAGVEVADVTYESPLGTMEAWLVAPDPASEVPVWAIHLHGWRADRSEALRTLPAFSEAGLTSLVVEYRNDPGAPPDPTGHYRFGRSEWEDVEAGIDYALSNGAEGIVLVGYSTGAAAVLSTLERSGRADAVVAVVLDSPNIDFGRVVKEEASKKVLVGPIMLPASLTAVAMTVADLRFDIGWEDINYVQRAADIDIPVLVFQGSADDTVPPSVAADLEAANPDRVTLVVTGADHMKSWNEDPEQYETILAEFLARVK